MSERTAILKAFEAIEEVERDMEAIRKGIAEMDQRLGDKLDGLGVTMSDIREFLRDAQKIPRIERRLRTVEEHVGLAKAGNGSA